MSPSNEQRGFVGVVVAAGRSTRFGGDRPKPFVSLGGRTLVARAVALLADRPAVRGVVVVLGADALADDRAAALRARPGVLAVVAGGATRSRSVELGLAATGDAPFVLVHDAARPLAPAALVERVIEATLRTGAAVPVLPVHDSVKQVDAAGRVVGSVDRATLRLAQTPQGSRADWLRDALARAHARGDAPTDEAAALEAAGRPVSGVTGDPANRKVTTPDDIAWLERDLGARLPDLRVGSGFDVHRVVAGRPMVLGGVRFEADRGPLGHSDGDVVLHAAIDALLGAAALGDIGAMFPPDDPTWRGADSADLLRRVRERLDAAGFVVLNLDLTVLAEAPRIGPRVDEIRAVIAACLEIEPGRIGVKATTLERMGPLGRGEGVGCQAVALVCGPGRGTP